MIDDGLKISFTPFFFEDLIAPNGFLSRDRECHACWYFYLLAQKCKETVGESIEDQTILESEPWMTKKYPEIRRSVQLLYGLQSPGDIDPYWPAVRLQAKTLGLPEPANEYVKQTLLHVN